MFTRISSYDYIHEITYPALGPGVRDPVAFCDKYRTSCPIQAMLCLQADTGLAAVSHRQAYRHYLY